MSSPRSICVALVDPVSTGAEVAIEAIARGYSVVAVWSRALPEELKGFVPAHAVGLKFHGSVDEAPSIAETADAVHRAAHIKVDAIICGAETGVELADCLSSQMGLASNGTQLGSRSNKHVQQQALRAVPGLRAVRETCGTDWSVVEPWILTQGLPVVLKPSDGGGSEGVKLCHSVAEARVHFEHLLVANKKLGVQGSAVLCQEYLRGEEYVVDCVSSNGVHKVMMVWRYDKRPCNGAAFVYFGMVPVAVDSPIAQQLIVYVTRVLDALYVRHGAMHGEVIVTPDGPCLVEMNCRSHGGDGCWMPLAKALTGSYCQVDALLDAYVEPLRFDRLPIVPGPFCSAGQEVLIVSSQEGVLRSAPGLDAARALASFVSLEAFVQPGERLHVTRDVFTQAASVVLVHSDPAVVAKDVATLRALEQSGDMFVLDEEVAPVPSPATASPQPMEVVARVRKEAYPAGENVVVSLPQISKLGSPQDARREQWRKKLAACPRPQPAYTVAFGSPFLCSAARMAGVYSHA